MRILVVVSTLLPLVGCASAPPLEPYASLIETHTEPDVGGTIKAGDGDYVELARAKIGDYCRDHEMSAWKTTKTESKKDYLGTNGSGSAYCGGYGGCWSSESSTAVYSYYDEISFKCEFAVIHLKQEGFIELEPKLAKKHGLKYVNTKLNKAVSVEEAKLGYVDAMVEGKKVKFSLSFD